jgi:iron(III) transport system substrate-binding protein
VQTRLRRWSTRWLAAGIVAGSVVALASCGNGNGDGDGDAGDAAAPAAAAGDEVLTIYSGRNEQLVSGLLDQLSEDVGVEVEVRYGDTGEMAAQILEEGDATPADVFFGQDAGALGALSDAGRLAPLPEEILETVPAEYRAQDGTWVATSARARVVAYDPRQVTEDELPEDLEALTDPRWRGQIGYPPSNASWQSFVTGVRLVLGEDGARDWLTRFAANDPVRFDNNNAVLDGVDSGQVALGLINHYYIYPRIDELGEDGVNARIHYVGGGSPLGLVNVAGAGVVAGTDSPEAAEAAVAFLLSETAQQYFADETAEYPVREGITSTVHDLPPVDSLQQPDIDLAELDSLEATQAMLQETGLA